MIDLQDLKAKAVACEARCPSPWRSDPYGVYSDHTPPLGEVVYRYMAACDPATVLGLIAEIERLKSIVEKAYRDGHKAGDSCSGDSWPEWQVTESWQRWAQRNGLKPNP